MGNAECIRLECKCIHAWPGAGQLLGTVHALWRGYKAAEMLQSMTTASLANV